MSQDWRYLCNVEGGGIENLYLFRVGIADVMSITTLNSHVGRQPFGNDWLSECMYMHMPGRFILRVDGLMNEWFSGLSAIRIISFWKRKQETF